MARYGVGLLLTLALLAPSGAAAQTPETPAPPACAAPSSEDTEAAKQAFREGQQAFSEGDYVRAAELWQSAYERDCTAHALLLNLATAQELLGRPDTAAQTLAIFNERAPDSPYVSANQKRIARLERTPVSPIRPRRDAARPSPCPVSAAPVAAGRGEPTGFSLPLVVAASGGLAALVGGIFYAEARVAASKAEDACGGPPGACTSRNAVTYGERARARAEASGWIAGIGLVTLSGGLAWELLSRRSSSETGSSTPLKVGSSFGTAHLKLDLYGNF
jgi:hypothetical protein